MAVEQTRAVRPVSSILPWSLLHFLPAGSCLGITLQWTVNCRKKQNLYALFLLVLVFIPAIETGLSQIGSCFFDQCSLYNKIYTMFFNHSSVYRCMGDFYVGYYE